MVKRRCRDKPLLRNGDPETILRDLAEKRNPIYAKARKSMSPAMTRHMN
jgi:shikimate kinase